MCKATNENFFLFLIFLFNFYMLNWFKNCIHNSQLWLKTGHAGVKWCSALHASIWGALWVIKAASFYLVSLQEFLMKCRGRFSVNLRRESIFELLFFFLLVLFLFMAFKAPWHRRDICTQNAPACNSLEHSIGVGPVLRKFPEAYNNSSWCKRNWNRSDSEG